MRHQGLIPWDDDIDLCMFESDEEKLLALRPIFEKHGLKLIVNKTFGYRIFHETESMELKDRVFTEDAHRYPFCDIFIMTIKKNKILIKEKNA